MNIVEQVFPAANPATPALICNGVTLTYGELEHAITRATADLLAAGLPVRTPDRVPRIGLAAPNGPDYIIHALAILRCGGCLVPIAGELCPAEREEIVAAVGLDAIILSDRMHWPQRLEAEGQSTPLPSLRATLLTDFPVPAPTWNEAALARLNPAFIRFSSGTTGRAKGVILSHETLLDRIELANQALAIGPKDRVIWVLSMAHHFAVSIMLYLVKGATTVIVDTHLAQEILSAGREHGGTIVYGAPFHHSLLATEPSCRPWPTLRLAVSTAAALPAATAEAFETRYGVPLSQGLGLIEVGLPLLNTADPLHRPTSVGRPPTGVDADLRDPHTGRPVGECETGELFLRCPGMLDGYLNPWQPREQLLAPGGWFRTGDLARKDADGFLHLVGRCKTVINVGGMKCFPEEVETVLATHPQVAAVRVIGREHPRFGTVPVAEIVPKKGEAPTIASLIALCRRHLSRHKIPSSFSFVTDLPRTASGKVVRHPA